MTGTKWGVPRTARPTRPQAPVIDRVDLRGRHPDTAYIKPEPGTATGPGGHLVHLGDDWGSAAPSPTLRPGDGGRDRQDAQRTERVTFAHGQVGGYTSRYTRPSRMQRRARRRRANKIAKASRKANR